MIEIVAAQINNTITNQRSHIISALELNLPVKWIDRRRLQFMSACDLGIKWDRLAASPTLFCINDDGRPCYAPETGAKR